MSPEKRNIDLSKHKELKRNAFTVPDGYFEQLTQNIVSKTGQENPPLGEKVGRQLPFQTPVGYFSQLEKNILAKTTEKETRVLPFIQQSWLQWMAVAASLLLLTLFYFGSKNINASASDELADISDTEILEFLNPSQASFEDYIWSHESADDILNAMIEEELSAYAEVLSRHTELNYEFEYFDY